MGFRVSGLGFRGCGLRFRVQGFEFTEYYPGRGESNGQEDAKDYGQ